MAKVIDAKARAEATFKKEQQAREGELAWTEYQARIRSVQERTARLRALRLARGTSPVVPDRVAPSSALSKLKTVARSRTAKSRSRA